MATRNYNEPDADMRQRMRTMHGHFLADANTFAEFNPDFGDDFAQRWAKALDAADQAKPGTVRVGELKEDTQAVTGAMEQSRQQVQSLFYYVEQAFPGNAGRLDQYGKKLFEKARKNQEQMRTLLELAVKAAERDAVALAAKGFSADKLKALQQLAQELTSTNTEQELKKGTNKEDGGDYVALQNAAYAFGQQISTAARVRFVEDAAKLQLYRLTDNPTAGRGNKGGTPPPAN